MDDGHLSPLTSYVGGFLLAGASVIIPILAILL
ncbi:hypothetical protein [Cyanophage S-TIM54]|nr:hypothetical protein [Cyanophage S-TIM54]